MPIKERTLRPYKVNAMENWLICSVAMKLPGRPHQIPRGREDWDAPVSDGVLPSSAAGCDSSSAGVAPAAGALDPEDAAREEAAS